MALSCGRRYAKNIVLRECQLQNLVVEAEGDWPCSSLLAGRECGVPADYVGLSGAEQCQHCLPLLGLA